MDRYKHEIRELVEKMTLTTSLEVRSGRERQAIEKIDHIVLEVKGIA